MVAAIRKDGSGGDLGRTGQREAGSARSTSSQLPAGSGTGEAVPASMTERRQRSVTHGVKAAPADEARAVRHSKRREALAALSLKRRLGGKRESELPPIE